MDNKDINVRLIAEMIRDLQDGGDLEMIKLRAKVIVESAERELLYRTKSGDGLVVSADDLKNAKPIIA